MPDYRLYLMTGDGHVRTAHEFQSRDDSEAVEHGERLRQGANAELWNLERRIKVYQVAAPDPA